MSAAEPHPPHPPVGCAVPRAPSCCSPFGTGLALVPGLFRIGEDLMDAPVQMLRTVSFVGLIPLGIAWLALVFAEQVNADAGIGFLMVQARNFLQTDVIVVCLIVYAFLGLLADFIVHSLERLLMQWRPTFTGR